MSDYLLLFAAFCVGAFMGGFTRAAAQDLMAAKGQWVLKEEIPFGRYTATLTATARTAKEAQATMVRMKAVLESIKETEVVNAP